MRKAGLYRSHTKTKWQTVFFFLNPPTSLPSPQSQSQNVPWLFPPGAAAWVRPGSNRPIPGCRTQAVGITGTTGLQLWPGSDPALVNNSYPSLPRARARAGRRMHMLNAVRLGEFLFAEGFRHGVKRRKRRRRSRRKQKKPFAGKKKSSANFPPHWKK